MPDDGPANIITPDSTGISGTERRTRWIKWAPLLLIAIGVASHLPALGWGFVWDDYIHQMILRERPDTAHLRPWSLYDFDVPLKANEPLYDAGLLPWWTESDFNARFFRPVTSLSIWLDYAIWGTWAPGYHITSLVLFAVFLLLAWRLFLSVGSGPKAAVWAVAFLSLDDVHLLPVGWIANRNTLLAALLVVATLLLVIRYSRTRGWWTALGALACLLLACGSKESAVATLPIAGVAILLFDDRTTGGGARRLWRRLAQSPLMWALAVAVVGFLGYYILAGYGAHSVVYPVPWRNPVQYALRIVLLVPIGIASLLFGVVTDLLVVDPQRIWTVGAGALIVVPLAGFVLLRTVGLTRVSLFALGWIAFALLAEAGGDISDRLWMNAAVGTSLLLGAFVDRVGPLRQRLKLRQAPVLLVAMAVRLAGIVAPLPATMIRTHYFAKLAEFDRDVTLAAPIDANAAPPTHVFLMNSPASMQALTMGTVWRVERQDTLTRTYPLQYGRRPLAWTREDDRTMVLTSNAEPFRTSHFERVFCSHTTPPPPGTQYATSGFTATVVATDDSGIRTVRFQLDPSISDPTCVFLAWNDGQFIRVQPPGVGETIELEAVPPPTPVTP